MLVSTSSPLESLPKDVLEDQIFDFLDRKSLSALSQTSKYFHQQLDTNKLFKLAFGQVPNIDPNIDIDTATARFLLKCGKQPDLGVNHNRYESPESRIEQWKWRLGFENETDRAVLDVYRKSLDLLKKTKATSILQLKTKLCAFWHLDRFIKDYNRFKETDITNKSAATSKIQQIFFFFLKNLFKCFYKPAASLVTEKTLMERSKETFATIGQFNHEDKEYVVVACQVMVDEDNLDNYTTYVSDTHKTFCRKGDTLVGIFKKDETPSFDSLKNTKHRFGASLGREIDEPSILPCITTEKHYTHDQLLSQEKRHLVIGEDSLHYRDSTHAPQGSDRVLDQKLTQIMIEMAQQNKTKTIKAENVTGDTHVVLMCAGFDAHLPSEQLRLELNRTNTKITEFRTNGQNKLFPPYKELPFGAMVFTTANIQEKNVSFTRGPKESWSDIIKPKPILISSDAAVLPEYWAKKPLINAANLDLLNVD